MNVGKYARKRETMKPIIGITPLYDEKKESIWMLPGYLEGIIEGGGIPIVLPFTKDEEVLDKAYDLCDGILFTGGQDIDPYLYNNEKMEECGVINQDKDFLEMKLFRKAYDDDKSILGICRGLHLINALLGGTLHQDLETYQATDRKIKHIMSAPYNREAHTVKILNDTPLERLLNKSVIPVNSYHHQGIAQLAGGLQVMAVSEDGLVESAYDSKKRFLWGFQWHPEFLYKECHDNQMIFKAFISAAKGEASA